MQAGSQLDRQIGRRWLGAERRRRKQATEREKTSEFFEEKGIETVRQLAPKPDLRLLGAYQGEQRRGTEREEKEGEFELSGVLMVNFLGFPVSGLCPYRWLLRGRGPY